MLIGISLGPGDPELMTFKAASSLKICARVYVPGEMAASLARPYCMPQIMDFPMIEDSKELERIWCENANTIAFYAANSIVGFACIGDVNTFSTFSHLEKVIKRYHPGIVVETIPGVGVVPAVASRFNAPLDQSFEVSDGSELGSIIRIKATRPKKLVEELRLQGFNDFVLGSRLCTAEERIIRGDMPEKSDYFSVLLARRQK